VVALTARRCTGGELVTRTSAADLVGDAHPIRAQKLGADLGDLRAVTFGIVPATNRGRSRINELPDLSPRIQVALFNILEENDVQARASRCACRSTSSWAFTANPEDYTARGQIITPLKDRIGAQVLTHYPRTRAEGVAIQRQESTPGPGVRSGPGRSIRCLRKSSRRPPAPPAPAGLRRR